jgi:hypothetical protein
MFQKLGFFAGLSNMLYDKYGFNSIKKGHKESGGVGPMVIFSLLGFSVPSVRISHLGICL